MSDRTPADVIAEAIMHDFVSPYGAAERILDAIAAVGYRVVPIPDDDTRALAEMLREWADFAAEGYGPIDWDDFDHDKLRAAAALLDRQPQDRPATCPTCGSDDQDLCAQGGLVPYPRRKGFCCPDSWHTDGTGDTR